MNDSTSDKAPVRDYRDTLFLPRTDFPMRAGLPQREPEILKRWQDMDLYGRTREAAGDGARFILHDGPPYANGNIHLGTALNKILKDVVSRSQWMMGKDANYVPGWDCHGLPIEWKVEETYRAKGLDKDEVPINEFRRECREFAARWIDVQREEFQRLGVLGDWQDPYTTMKFESEARIARELMKFAMTGQLYRGSKPVMWSVVEHTALAEAEVEYHDYTSDTVWVTFPITHVREVEGDFERLPPDVVWDHEKRGLEAKPKGPLAEKIKQSLAESVGTAGVLQDLVDGQQVSIVIWTTTPWTIPGNRAISFSGRIGYGLYRVDNAPAENWAKAGDHYVIADALVAEVMKAARVDSFSRLRDIPADVLSGVTCAHPLHGKGYDFAVPLLEGDHVTDEAGTGFVHTAPGHGREDFDVWTENAAALEAAGIDPAIPFTVDAAGAFTADAPGFEGARVINDKGEKGEANDAVIQALVAAGKLIARGRLKHQYPHSWRSKKPVIFRNTPQWFITMGDGKPDGLRARALKAIDEVQWVPPAGRNRMRGMIETRPDWVISRQRAWGVPITVFRNQVSGVTIPGAEFDRSEELIDRIAEAFEAEGADAWFADGARERFLDGLVDDPSAWEKVSDILDVWFESGSTHAFVLEVRDDLKVQRQHEGGSDRVMYLEGSDQHRGWFHSSLLESCGTRGRAPYDIVLTHGFVVDEDGRKMSKSLGNVVEPQDVIRQSGAEILRLWAASSDYAEDLRLGPEILKSNVDAYRKLRNTLRYLLGALAGYSKDEAIAAADMPELERYMLHRLHETGVAVRRGYETFDFKRAYWALVNFMTIDLSAFYFDIRKDALYCDPLSSTRRRACRTLMDKLFHCLTAWLAPVMCFTMEEAWQSRFGEGSVHLQRFPDVEASWRDAALGAKWDKVREVRRVITGALEIERQVKKTIGASLEAAPVVYVSDPALLAALDGVDLAEISITSDARLVAGEAPADAFALDEVAGVAVVPEHARGRKCARSWKISEDVGADPEFPDITPRDAEAVREWQEAEGRS